MTTISCFTATETQLSRISERLKSAGLFDRYEEQAYGENILVSVRTNTFDEREIVKAILREVGITEYVYGDENAA